MGLSTLVHIKKYLGPYQHPFQMTSFSWGTSAEPGFEGRISLISAFSACGLVRTPTNRVDRYGSHLLHFGGASRRLWRILNIIR